jgi:hypothetical protein
MSPGEAAQPQDYRRQEVATCSSPTAHLLLPCDRSSRLGLVAPAPPLWAQGQDEPSRRVAMQVCAPPRTRSTVRRVIRWTAIASAIGASGGGIFGTAFGALVVLICGESWRIVPIAGYFALCGAAAGAVLGAFGAVIDGPEEPALANAAAPSSRETGPSLQTTEATPQKSYRLLRWRRGGLRP